MNMNKALGIAFSALVFLAGAFAFSPRSQPVLPTAGVRVDTVLLLDAARAGARLVAVGERGHIFLSDDEGRSWRLASSPTQTTLTSLYFADSKQGWAVGHDMVILRTADSGETWQQVHAAPEQERPLLNVWFRNAQEGVAIGAYGAFLETKNGGRMWSERNIIEGDRHFNAFAARGNHYFIAGETGTGLSSADDGAHWKPLVFPYKGSFFGILVDGERNLLAFGLRGNIFHSADLGQTWQGVDNPSQASLLGGDIIAPGRVVLVGHDGTTLQSRDGGRTFNLYQIPGGATLVTALLTANGDLLVFGERGVKRIAGVKVP